MQHADARLEEMLDHQAFRKHVLKIPHTLGVPAHMNTFLSWENLLGQARQHLPRAGRLCCFSHPVLDDIHYHSRGVVDRFVAT